MFDSLIQELFGNAEMMIGDQSRSPPQCTEVDNDGPAVPRIPPMIALSAKIFNERITVKFSRDRYEVSDKPHYTSSITTINDHRRSSADDSGTSSSSDIENRPTNFHRSAVEDTSSSVCDCEEMPPRSKSPRFEAFSSHSSGSSETETKPSTKERLECDFCSKTFSKLRKFTKHKKRHYARKKFSCKWCDKILCSQQAWSYHVKATHKMSKQFVCNYCEKSFVTKQQLERHIKNHKYICHFCSKPFSARYKLREHKEVHRAFKCNLCCKGFFRMHRLRRHKEIEHEGEEDDSSYEEQQPPPKQPKKEPSSERDEFYFDVKPAIVVPTTEQCKYCNQTFPSKDDLQQHLKVTGENLFICVYCLNFFDDDLSFSHHLLEHRKENIFMCTVCSKTFVTMDLLEDHFTTHSGLSIS